MEPVESGNFSPLTPCLNPTAPRQKPSQIGSHTDEKGRPPAFGAHGAGSSRREQDPNRPAESGAASGRPMAAPPAGHGGG